MISDDKVMISADKWCVMSLSMLISSLFNPHGKTTSCPPDPAVRTRMQLEASARHAGDSQNSPFKHLATCRPSSICTRPATVIFDWLRSSIILWNNYHEPEVQYITIHNYHKPIFFPNETFDSDGSKTHIFKHGCIHIIIIIIIIIIIK